MRHAMFAFVVVALMPTIQSAHAQPPKPRVKPKAKADSVAIPKKAFDALKPILAKAKETSPKIEESRPGEFIKIKLVATDIKTTPATSNYADKPYMVQITWLSEFQQTKIYSDADKAKASDEWLPLGVFGTRGLKLAPHEYKATLFYVDGKWTLNEIEWSTSTTRPNLQSTRFGQKTEWQNVFADIAPPAATK